MELCIKRENVSGKGNIHLRDRYAADLSDNEKIIGMHASAEFLALHVCASDGEKQSHYVVINGLKSAAYDEVRELRISNNGCVILYTYRLGRDWYIHEGSRIQGPFEEVGNCCFTEEGILNIYSVKKGGRWTLLSRHGKLDEASGTEGFSIHRSYDNCITHDTIHGIMDKMQMVVPEPLPDCSYSLYTYSVSKGSGKDIYFITYNTVYGPYSGGGLIYMFTNPALKALLVYDRSSKYYVIKDDTIHGPFNKAEEVKNNAGLCIFTAVTSEGNFIYYGDEIYGPYKSIERCMCAGEKNPVLYAEIRNSDKNDKITVMIDGKAHGQYDRAYGPFIKPDVGGICYFGENSGAVYLYDGEEAIAGPYDGIESFNLTAMEAGKLLLSYHFRRHGKLYYMKGGKEIGPYDSIGSWIHYNREHGVDTFTANKDGMVYLVQGEREYGPYREVGAVSNMMHGKMCRYIARTEKKWRLYHETGNFDIDILPGFMCFHLICNDRPSFCDNVITVTKDPGWSPDSRIDYIISGNKLAGPYRFVSHYSTPDGKTHAYHMEGVNETGEVFTIPGNIPEENRKMYERDFRHVKHYEQYIMTGSKIRGPYNRCRVYGMLTDGRLVASIRHGEDEHYLLMGNKRLGPFTEIVNVRLNDSGTDIATIEVMDNRGQVDEEKGPVNSVIALLAAETDAVLLVCCKEKGSYIIFRGETYGSFKKIYEYDIRRSKDNNAVAFKVYDNSSELYYLIFEGDLKQGILSTDCNFAYIVCEKENDVIRRHPMCFTGLMDRYD